MKNFESKKGYFGPENCWSWSQSSVPSCVPQIGPKRKRRKEESGAHTIYVWQSAWSTSCDVFSRRRFQRTRWGSNGAIVSSSQGAPLGRSEPRVSRRSLLTEAPQSSALASLQNLFFSIPFFSGGRQSLWHHHAIFLLSNDPNFSIRVLLGFRAFWISPQAHFGISLRRPSPWSLRRTRSRLTTKKATLR